MIHCKAFNSLKAVMEVRSVEISVWIVDNYEVR